jgi:hypothetical protein
MLCDPVDALQYLYISKDRPSLFIRYNTPLMNVIEFKKELNQQVTFKKIPLVQGNHKVY